MTNIEKRFFAIILTAIWICISEFVRNELLFKSYWLKHFDSLNITFPSEPINGAIWLIWSFLFAIVIFIISRKFRFIQTALLSWFVGFVLMWVVLYNLGVLPTELLLVAVPLSMIEVIIATFIIKRIA